jgi:hypothetical protein
MPWENTPEKRRHDAQTYGSAEYRRNRELAMRRAGGACEEIVNGRPCRSRDRVSCDHDTPVSQGGTHHLDNLVIRCFTHHARKTAQEGKGYRAGNGRGSRQPPPDPPLATRTKW